MRGSGVVESLHHVLFVCLMHQESRAAVLDQGILDGGYRDLTFHHRDRWSWKQYIMDLSDVRRMAKQMGGLAAELAVIDSVAGVTMCPSPG